ncbi:MAG: hypothetical protein PVI57_14590 [Gemmatimonadota bacterium]|jgi:hypothetical protein
MTSLDEGRLLAYLDGEMEPGQRAEVEAWLGQSGAARAALAGVRERRNLVGRALAGVDVPVPDLETVRARIRARVEVHGTTATAAAAVGGRRRWAQAAALVLFLGAAGASAAVPGSPVRAWLASLLDGGEPSATVPAAAVDEASPDDMGLRVRPSEGRLAIDLAEVPEETEVVVRLVEGERGGVYAPRASFRSGAGRIEATLTGGATAGAGTDRVRVEIPRGATLATLHVDGALWLRKDGERLDFPGPAALVSSDSIVFRDSGG